MPKDLESVSIGLKGKIPKCGRTAQSSHLLIPAGPHCVQVRP